MKNKIFLSDGGATGDDFIAKVTQDGRVFVTLDGEALNVSVTPSGTQDVAVTNFPASQTVSIDDSTPVDVNVASPNPLPVDIASQTGGPFAVSVENADVTNPLAVQFGDTPQLDSFGRLRVSQPRAIFNSTFVYSENAGQWATLTTGGGGILHLPAEQTVLVTAPANLDTVVRQTREYFQYQPGKSQLIVQTFAFFPGDPFVTKRVGYFDEANGIFFEEVNGENFIVLRSSTSGVAVETRIPQASWNLNTYPSLDPTKAQILVIDVEWLGVGRVRVGFYQAGRPVYCHEFLNANLNETTYMGAGSLPCRVEVVSEGGTPALSTGGMRHICTSVVSEGNQDDDIGAAFSAARIQPKTASTTYIPVVAIRLKALLNSKVPHSRILIDKLTVLNDGNSPVHVGLFLNPSTLTGASWGSAGADSVVEFDVNASAVSGGQLIRSFHIPATNQATNVVQSQIPLRGLLYNSIDGIRGTLVIAVRALSGTDPVAASIDWTEYQ
jgi:hypothetical protein